MIQYCVVSVEGFLNKILVYLVLCAAPPSFWWCLVCTEGWRAQLPLVVGAADEFYTKRPLPKILCVVQWSEKKFCEMAAVRKKMEDLNF